MKKITIVYEVGKSEPKVAEIEFEKDDDSIKILADSVQSIAKKYCRGVPYYATLVSKEKKVYLVIMPFEKYLRLNLADIDSDLSLGEEMDL